MHSCINSNQKIVGKLKCTFDIKLCLSLSFSCATFFIFALCRLSFLQCRCKSLQHREIFHLSKCSGSFFIPILILAFSGEEVLGLKHISAVTSCSAALVGNGYEGDAFVQT